MKKSSVPRGLLPSPARRLVQMIQVPPNRCNSLANISLYGFFGVMLKNTAIKCDFIVSSGSLLDFNLRTLSRKTFCMKLNKVS